MTPRLAIARPHGWIYRVARRTDAWAWPDWTYAHDDGTFGSRFDDPRAEYRVLYASSQREGAFAETLARFRVDLHVAAELQAIDGDPEDAGYPDPLPAGIVPAEWIETRRSASRDTTAASWTSAIRRRSPTCVPCWPTGCSITGSTSSTPVTCAVARPAA